MTLLHGVSPTLAKALLAEVKPRVDLIRVVLKERKKRHDPLVVGGLAGPPAPDKDERSGRLHTT
jgi:cleavage stimulation factor subunit 3